MSRKTFKINRKQFELETEQVKRDLEGWMPDTDFRYYVVVEGRYLPLRQAFTKLTGHSSGSLISSRAADILESLGFRILRIDMSDPAVLEAYFNSRD